MVSRKHGSDLPDCTHLLTVIAVADTADLRLDRGFGKPLTIFDRDVLAAALGVMDETAAARRSAIVKGLIERIENEAGMGDPARSPPDDPPGELIDHKGDVDEPGLRLAT